jgi:hypothetical protein
MTRFAIRQLRGTTRVVLLCGSALLLLSGGGCGNGRADLPPNDAARTALEGALKTWRDGGKPGPLAGTEPPVQVFDTPWSQGERLGSYEILGEEAGAAERRFSVRLSLTKPQRVQETRYYVLGRGPILVFREEDYLRNVNMEDGPKLDRTGNTRTRRR